MSTKNELPEMTLERVFDAPRELVFKAWTEPARLAQWWGPRGFTSPRCEWDPRSGGLIRVDMRGPNGVIYPMGGAYREIVAPERIVFTAGALDANGELLFEILNTVTFAENDGRTTLTLHTRVLRAAPGAEKYLNGHKAGWSQSIDRLGGILEAAGEVAGSDREIVISRIFNAPAEMVWDAMTDPAQVVQWWGPRGFTTTIEEMDVRPGGVWRHVMHGPDGVNYPNHSLFTVVEKPRRIVYSHGGAREGGPEAAFEATWTFDALDDGRTKTTIRMVFPSTQARDTVVKEYGAIEGGKQTLERLAEKLDAMPLVVERTFDAPAELLWKAITERDRMREWFFDLEEFTPAPGFEFRFAVEYQEMNYVHLCRVTEVITGRKLAFTWRYEGYDGDSLVTFELFSEGSKTRVRLTHDGLETFPPIPEFSRRNFLNGWTMLIGESLKKYLGRSG